MKISDNGRILMIKNLILVMECVRQVLLYADNGHWVCHDWTGTMNAIEHRTQPLEFRIWC